MFYARFLSVGKAHLLKPTVCDRPKSGEDDPHTGTQAI